MKKTFQQFVLAATLLLVSSQMQAQLSIGQSYQGGKIAYILQSGDPGYIAGETHGLIAAAADQGGSQWFVNTNITTGATGTAIGTGNSNTDLIVSVLGTTVSYAARVCSDLVLDGYSDWYLPSKNELNKLFTNRDAIGGFGRYYYWSSTEQGSNSAWIQSFNTGTQYGYYKNEQAEVRAVRAF